MDIPACLLSPHYRTKSVTGIGRDEAWQRLDPSNVIRWDGRYYVYYTKAPARQNLYHGSVWCAVSDDGFSWTELGEALAPAQGDTWDNFGVITPYVVPWENSLYLFYTASREVPGEPWQVRGENNKRCIGAAVAEDPAARFRRVGDQPVLAPGPEGAWDSYLVDDTHILYWKGKFYLYYKGGDRHVTAETTRWGVAMAECVTGPYRKYEGNPFLDSGHTVCVWKQGSGVAALVDNAGPQRHTAQYSEDGLHFVKTADILPRVDTGCGPYDPAAHRETGWAAGVSWGLTAQLGEVPYLMRFEVDCDMSREKEEEKECSDCP